MSHHLQVALDGIMEGRLGLLDFSVAFIRISHSGLFYKLSGGLSGGAGGQFLSVLPEFLSGRTQRVLLNVMVSVSGDVVSVMLQGSVSGPLILILYTSAFFLHFWEIYCGLCK